MRRNDHAGSGSLGADGTVHWRGADRRAPLPTRVSGLPALPDSYTEVLDRGLAALELDLPRSVRTAIDDHVRLLIAWTTAINLTAIREPSEIARLHVVDSLAAVPVLRRAGASTAVDIGSGGGFPGLPIALALPARRGLLVESVSRKAAFLRAAVDVAAGGAANRVEVANERAEVLGRRPADREAWDAVTARAIGSLADLVELAFPLLRPGGCLVAWKRGDIAAEIEPARRAARALGGGAVDVRAAEAGGLLPDHRLVVVTKAGPTPDAFPRDPALRRRRPW